MHCAIKNCKVKSNINPRSGLCPSCDQCFNGVTKRMQRHDRQSEARDAQHDTNRGNLHQGEPGVPAGASHLPPSDNLFSFPNLNTPQVDQRNLPKVDLGNLITSYETRSTGNYVDGPKVLKDLLGVMINVYAKQSDIDAVKKQHLQDHPAGSQDWWSH